MTHSLYPPALERQRERDRFDPIVEGARHGILRELSLAIWKRVCADATDGAGRLDEKLAQQIAGDGDAKQAQPVRAEYLAKAGGKSAHLTFFIGPKRDGGGLVLIDLQQGGSTRSHAGGTTDACFAEFSSKRSYPDGRISFDVAANPDWGIDAFSKVVEVEPSKTDKAIAIIGEIAGLAAGPLFFISPPLAAVFQIIASAADIYNNFRTGQFISERTAIDVMMMAAALVPLGEALEARLIAERLPDVAGKVNKYVRIIGLGSGVPGGVLMEREAIAQLVEINRSSMSPEEKTRAMASALSNLVTQTLLLAIVIKHVAEAPGQEPPGGKKTPAFEIPGWGTMPEGSPAIGRTARSIPRGSRRPRTSRRRSAGRRRSKRSPRA